jgi:hypothetical protein
MIFPDPPSRDFFLIADDAGVDRLRSTFTALQRIFFSSLPIQSPGKCG